MTLAEIIKEEWSKCTAFGRVTWIPVFAVLLCACGALVVSALPLLMLMYCTDKPIRHVTKWTVGLFYK